MNGNSIDDLYERVVDSLPSSQRKLARSLPYVLKLAPVSSARWSDVFSHEVTLGAPGLVAQAFPQSSPEIVRAATLGHALSVIEAFGRDRIADGQVAGKDELLKALLDQLRAARNGALATYDPECERELALADRRTRVAIVEERNLLRAVAPVSFAEYERVSLRKQALGFPGSLTLARALDAGEVVVAKVQRMLEGVWLGLQIEDDVMDWEDDWRSGGAWAVCLAAALPVRSRLSDEAGAADSARHLVFDRGVLRSMLERSMAQYRVAGSIGRELGALRLAEWAKTRELEARRAHPSREKHAGYSIRVRASSRPGRARCSREVRLGLRLRSARRLSEGPRREGSRLRRCDRPRRGRDAARGGTRRLGREGDGNGAPDRTRSSGTWCSSTALWRGRGVQEELCRAGIRGSAT